MTKPTAIDQRVDTYIDSLSPALADVARGVRAVIDVAIPDATVALWHGSPVWSLGDRPGNRPVCLIRAYASYVTFSLWNGTSIGDQSGRLETSAGDKAHVKLRSEADIDPELFTSWLRHAHKLAANA
jgi:hypothetical protein